MTSKELKQRRRIEARALHDDGLSIRAIATRLGVSAATIHADLHHRHSPLDDAQSPNSTPIETGTDVQSTEGLSSREADAAAKVSSPTTELSPDSADELEATVQGLPAEQAAGPIAGSLEPRARPPTTSNARVPRGGYSEEEIERGLHALALLSGNTHRAARALAEQGLPIPRETLEGWKRRTHADRYRRIAEEELPARYWRIAEASEDLAERIAEVEGEVLAKVKAELPNLQAKDAAGALRNLSVSRAVSIDKASVVRGRPTEIREERSLPALLKVMQQRFPEVVSVNPELIESTAEEVEDGE